MPTYSFLEVMKMISEAEDVNFLRSLGAFLEGEKKEYSLVHLRTMVYFQNEMCTALIQEKAQQFVDSQGMDDGLMKCPICEKETCRYSEVCYHCGIPLHDRK